MATSNLNLPTLSSDNAASNFPATFNDAMDKIDAAFGGIGSASTTLTVMASRGNLLSGGAYCSGKLGIVNFKFHATATASNSPQIASIGKAPVVETALSCIDITSGIGSAITGAVPCGAGTDGKIYVKEITSDHIYAVSGICVCA